LGRLAHWFGRDEVQNQLFEKDCCARAQSTFAVHHCASGVCGLSGPRSLFQWLSDFSPLFFLAARKMETPAMDFGKEMEAVLLAPDGSPLGAAAPAAIGGKILGLYFSAHWCPPCKAFTPKLADFYRNLKSGGRDDFEIIFVSSDKSAAEFAAYARTMPWLAIDFERRDLQAALGQAFNVQGIPTLVWLNKDGGDALFLLWLLLSWSFMDCFCQGPS
jgi:thiol-disulfide isomerase/thioredoxin